MTEPLKYDPQLAWDIQEWSDLGDNGEPILNRGQIKNLANFLGEHGYTKGKTRGLGALVDVLEDAGAKLVDAAGPILEDFRKPR